MTEAHYNLLQFFGGYLNEDWPEEYGSAERAVEKFLSESSLETIASTLKELDEVIQKYESGMLTADFFFTEFGCAYDPKGDGSGVDMLVWLKELRKTLERWLQSHRP